VTRRLSAEARLAALEDVFRALAHPARRQILLTMHFRGDEMTAGEIAGRFAHSWPTTTRHIRVLEQAGLISQTKNGRERIYRLDRERLSMVNEWLEWFEQPPA
jgi:DNA-binding transcriptional ArsR family regulator